MCFRHRSKSKSCAANPHGSPVDEHVPSPLGFPALRQSPYACMLSPLPRRNHWVLVSLSSPVVAAFPATESGRLPHYPFRGLLSVHFITACKLAGSLDDPLHRRLR